MGEVIDTVEENFVSAAQDFIDAVCADDAILQQAIADSYVAFQKGTQSERMEAYNKVLERKTEILRAILKGLDKV